MNVWGITHRGMVREQNQDAFACRTLPDGRIIALVCDGMGGARAGNIASTMAVELFMEEFLSRKEDESDRVRMERAASRANGEVFHRSNVDMECSGMGTTLVAALAGPHETVILNEGDSRAYHVTPEGITRVTRDHSLVEDLVERGDLTRDQARVHPHKNLITRALGAESHLRADCFYLQALPGHYLLLCSDGLSNCVSVPQIEETLARTPFYEAADALVQKALEGGGLDNITVLLMQVEAVEENNG